jgi:flagellar hook-associated protein 1 FlgK
LHDHAVDLSSLVSSARLRSEARQAQTATRAATLDGQMRAKGVDTDAQMQKLLVLEQSYAANAKVILTLDQMMRTLLEI